ncbi:hypothetical protein KIPB_007519, partial [Kipferlia bialata]
MGLVVIGLLIYGIVSGIKALTGGSVNGGDGYDMSVPCGTQAIYRADQYGAKLKFNSGDNPAGYGSIYIFRESDPTPSLVNADQDISMGAQYQSLGAGEFAMFGPAWVPDGDQLRIGYSIWGGDPQISVFNEPQSALAWFDEDGAPSYSFADRRNTGSYTYLTSAVSAESISGTAWDNVVMSPFYMGFENYASSGDSYIEFDATYNTPTYQLSSGKLVSVDEEIDAEVYQYIAVDATCSGEYNVYQLYLEEMGMKWYTIVLLV